MIHREMIGLDLGSHSAKVVRATRMAGRLILRDFDWVHLPQDPAERGRLLTAFMADKGYDNIPCVVGVPGSDVMLNAIDVTERGSTSIADIVATEQSRVESVTQADTASDHIVFRAAGRRFLLLAMARTDAIGRAAAVLSDLGEEDIGDIVPGSMALYRAVYEVGRKHSDGCTLCVDIGHAGAEVVVGRGSKVLFARCLSSDAAGGKKDGRDLTLPAELAACMETFHASFPEAGFAVKRIVLSGGGALRTDIVDAVKQATGLDVLLLREWARQTSTHEMERYGRAIGLAASGLRRGGTGISLLPHALRECRILAWQKRYWMLAGLTVIGLMLLLVGGSIIKLRWNREYLRLRQVELAGLHALDRKLGVTDKLNDELERRTGPFRVAVENGEVLQQALIAVARSKHPDDWVSLFADANAYFGTIPMPASDDTMDAPAYPDTELGVVSVIVEGYTPVSDFSTVGEMIERLQEQPGVSDADLLGDEKLRSDPERDARWENTGCSLFVIEMTMELP